MSKGSIKVRGPEIARLRREKRLTQRELADLIGITEGRVAKIEKAKVAGMHSTKFRALAERLKMDPDELERRVGVAEEFDANVEPYSEQRHVEVPVFDMTVAAGHWVDVTDVGEVMRPGMIDHGFFRVRIRGDSMEPAYRDGEMVEFRCMRELRDVLEAGKDYYVQKNDGTATFKRLAKIDEEELLLQARNAKKYPKPMPVMRADIVRMAKAVAKVMIVE